MIFVSLLLYLLLLLLYCSGQGTATCSYGDVRLIPTSSDDNVGRVEMCDSSQWLPIRDEQWDDQDAKVTCGQLGFAKEGATAFQRLRNNTVNRYQGVTRFNCSGSELMLVNCTFTYSFQTYFTRNYAGIKCLLRKPCQPQRSSFHSITSTGVSFSWIRCSSSSGSKVAPTVEYLVSCINVVEIHRLTSTTISVNNLCPNKRYSCYVYGIDNLGRLGTRQTFTFTTTKIAPQFAPYDFNYTFITSTWISLAWTPPPMDDRSGQITQYQIQYSCQSSYRCRQTQIYYRQSLTYEVSGLQSGEEYIFYIAACVESICGNIRSRQIVTVPPRVSGFVARSTSTNTARLSWSRPTGAPKYYIIEVTDMTTSSSAIQYIANSATVSTDIYSLHPYHLYKFSIAAFTVFKGPVESQTLHMPQAVPTGGPQVVNCEVLNLTTLSVNWGEPHHLEQNGPIEHFWVYVWNNDTNKFVYINVMLNMTAASGVQVTSLDPYHNYNCSVAAFARGGLGPFTTANVWLADYANSGAPMNLEALEIDSNSTSIHWLEPNTKNQNATIQYYRITVHNVIESNTTEFLVQENFYQVTSLHPHYHYTITVEAVIMNTIGPNTSINVKTSEDIPSKAPQNLQATKISAHSVTLKWEAPPLSSQNGIIIGYTIQVLKVDNTESLNPLRASKEPNLKVTNLEDNTEYNFSVAANTSIGAGPYTTHIIAKTKNYALEVGTYLGSSLLSVLMVAIIGICVVCYCYRSKLKQCSTSKWFTKGSKESANANLSEHGIGNDYNLNQHLRGRASRDDGREQTPELPDREYLEDIDFVCKEFDLFFKRKPDLPSRMDDDLKEDIDYKNEDAETEVKVACPKEQPTTMEKCVEEASHYMSLKKAQEDGQGSTSVYQSLQPRKQRPIVYQNVNLKEKSNSESHYQPLMLTKQGSKDYTPSHYQALNAKPT